MNNTKVSVIIPVYNTEKYLDDAINSILRQTLKDIEIIIVNDGSTDNSFKILENFAHQDSRIKIITHENNKGLSEARNTGIKVVQGQYLYFFDSDDILELDCLELCYKKCNEENLDFLFFDAITFYDDNYSSNLRLNYQRTKSLEIKTYSGVEILNILLQKKAYKDSACLSFIRTEFLRRLNLQFIPHIYFEDIPFTLQLYLYANRVSLIQRSFFHRRMRNGSIMSTSISEKQLNHLFLIVDDIIRLKKSAKNRNSKKAIKKRLRNLLNSIVKKLRYFDFKIIFAKTVKLFKAYSESL